MAIWERGLIESEKDLKSITEMEFGDLQSEGKGFIILLRERNETRGEGERNAEGGIGTE